MTARGHRPKGPAGALPPLEPEAAAALQDQVARVAGALEAGQDPAALQDLLTPRPQDPSWDLHLMAALGALAHPAVPALLAAVFGSAPDKARHKALKRVLHNLKTRGVPVPEELLPREEVTVGKPRGATTALASEVLGNGDSYLILEGPGEILRGNFLVARVNDREGFKECHLLNLKRSQQAEFWDHFRQQGLTQWFPVPPAYAVRFMEEAYQAAPQAPGVGRYAALRPQIFKHWGSPADAPDLEQVLPEVSPGEAARLMEPALPLALDPLFHSWMPSLEEVTPWFHKIKEVQESPLVLSEAQRRVRIEAVVEEATRDLYPPETRPDWARRLKTMAYYLELAGRREEARSLLANAAGLTGEPGRLSGENPFLKGLVQYSLRLAWKALAKPQEAESPSGLVLPPTESPLIRR